MSTTAGPLGLHFRGQEAKNVQWLRRQTNEALEPLRNPLNPVMDKAREWFDEVSSDFEKICSFGKGNSSASLFVV